MNTVDADDTDDAHRRNERYCDFVGLIRVTYHREAFISMFQEPMRSS